MSKFEFYDFQRRDRSSSIDLVFPGWRGNEEVVVVLAPHDDDALLGPGYVTSAAIENGADVAVVVFNDGRAGYSRPELKDDIVDVRKRETLEALSRVGVRPDRVFRFDFPDFSGIHHLGWVLPDGSEGTFSLLVRRLRALKATRLVFANGFREHIDHWAVSLSATFDGPQVGDPVVVDWGEPTAIRTYLQYSVWGKFDPLDAQLNGRDPRIRANRGVAASWEVEERLQRALREWASQGEIIEGIIESRRERRLPGDPPRYLELYLEVDPRPKFDYGPYRELVGEIDERRE
ncbi:MAG: PIG-L deacetylase family protein [Promethearchaeota archaeon]